MIKPNPENFKNCPHLCAYHCAQLSYTTQHGAVLIIFPLNLQTSITAQILSTGGEGGWLQDTDFVVYSFYDWFISGWLVCIGTVSFCVCNVMPSLVAFAGCLLVFLWRVCIHTQEMHVCLLMGLRSNGSPPFHWFIFALLFFASF